MGDDTISRQSAIDAIVAQTIGYTVDEIKAECEENIFKENGYLGGLKDAINAIEDMQSAQPKKRTEERTETHACDCISRQAAIAEIARWIGYIDEDMILRIQTGLKKLPSSQPEVLACGEGELIAQPQRKKGTWIDKGWNGDWHYQMDGRGMSWHEWQCSECNHITKGAKWHFCPKCGADMEDPEDIPMEYFESGGR